MNPDSQEDWLDHVSGPRPDAGEVARLLGPGVLTPAERRRLDDELALNRVLDAHRPGPVVSSNFASMVVDRVAREGQVSRPGWPSWPRWAVIGWPRAMAWAGAMGLAGVLAVVVVQRVGPGIGTSLAALGAPRVGPIPAMDPSVLADFDAVRLLGSTPRTDDEQLILALVQ